MSQASSPESFLHLPIDFSENPNRVPFNPNGVQDLANLVVETVLQSGLAPDLLEQLRVGNVAVSAVFGPEDWLAARNNLAVHGGVGSDGNTLTVSGTTQDRETNSTAIVFRRAAPDQPYRPESCQPNAVTVRFPKNTTEALPNPIHNELYRVADMVAAVRERLANPDAGIRWVPYVYVSDL